MIIVTGGAGFIGSNLVKTLNDMGRSDIIVVDNLTNGHKFVNLADCDIADYWDKDDFLDKVYTEQDLPAQIDVIFHNGACSATTQWDGKYMMENNYEYSKTLLTFCLERQIPLIYASSAAVYGGSDTFKEERSFEKPLNVYGYSKWQFDQYVRQHWSRIKSQVVGLRYFNVYGPREQHKGSMASVAFHLYNQMKRGENPKLFGEYAGYGPGMQMRDFIYVGDVVAASLWLWQNPEVRGIFNLGTGQAEPFKEVAEAVIRHFGRGEIEYIPFPEHLRGAYQAYTQADMSKLREAGYAAPFKTVAEGTRLYLEWLEQHS